MAWQLNGLKSLTQSLKNEIETLSRVCDPMQHAPAWRFVKLALLKNAENKCLSDLRISRAKASKVGHRIGLITLIGFIRSSAKA